MNRSIIESEIKSDSPEEEKELLLKLLYACQWESQWNVLSNCHHEKTGVFSYQSKRIWTLSEFAKKLQLIYTK